MIDVHTLHVRYDIELNLFEKKALNMALILECIDLSFIFLSPRNSAYGPVSTNSRHSLDTGLGPGW